MPASRTNFFGGHIHDSPPQSPIHSDDEAGSSGSLDEGDHDDGASDSTLEDQETQFGHPLERIPRKHDVQHGALYNSHDSDQVNKLLGIPSSNQSSNASSRCTSRCPSRSASALSFTSTFAFERPVYYEDVIDTLLEQQPNPFLSTKLGSRGIVSYHGGGQDRSKKASEQPTSISPILIHRLPRSSPRLLLLLDLNRPELRNDPWNACPHKLQLVEKGEHAYLCMQPLWEFNDPPFLTVSNYIDFFRQMLEGLTFFHEQSIAGFRCHEPSSYMVDLGSSPENPTVKAAKAGQQTASGGGGDNAKWFDRSRYPVRYYFINFSDIQRIEPGSDEDTNDDLLPSFSNDLRQAGEFMERLLQAVPSIIPKFKSLAKGMQSGQYSADGARRLFEALCTALEPRVFESSAIPISMT